MSLDKDNYHRAEDVEIDLVGGSHNPDYFQGIPGEHATPVDLNYDRPHAIITNIPRAKSDGVEEGPRFKVYRQEDLRTDGINALRIKEPGISLLLPIQSVVSRVYLSDKETEVIVYWGQRDDRGKRKVEFLKVSSSSVTERRQERV